MKKFLGFLLSLAMIIGIGAATITTTGCSKKDGDKKDEKKDEKKDDKKAPAE